eukprot:13531100-Ditylum_brightwellii.AAC.1
MVPWALCSSCGSQIRYKLERVRPSAGCIQMGVVFIKAYSYSDPKCFEGVFYSTMLCPCPTSQPPHPGLSY